MELGGDGGHGVQGASPSYHPLITLGRAWRSRRLTLTLTLTLSYPHPNPQLAHPNPHPHPNPNPYPNPNPNPSPNPKAGGELITPWGKGTWGVVKDADAGAEPTAFGATAEVLLPSYHP